MSLKKRVTGIALALVLGASVFAFAGCGSSGDSGTAASGEINGGGSTSVQKIMDAAGEEFTAQNPDVQFTYSGTGSSDGIKGAADGTYSFGGVSRELKDEEKGDLTEQIFAYDGIAMITHPSNPVTSISSEDLTKIYTGEITNWSQVGGNDAPIVVVSREDGSGTRTAVEELLGFENKLKSDATVKEGNGNVQTTVAGNENAIGYVSLTFVDDTVKKLEVDGVEATVENVLNKSYPISRPFLVVYNESKVDDTTKAFLDFLMSDEGQNIVEKEGGIKVADEQ
ncbi:MAG: phosphate ABC transporter substrate-binding protein [Eubacterium sp.]|nr:phosphate ABC transporter substrate-binding protein [Eubacterium sp.]